ncbi:TonB-dependent receptor [Aestuariicella hydrocarbonica]|uniref:TonB-dependent receptor n=1 Tax=Pseudomaricurvus hydrocarbonicus TaxID=1470433 RepID=A0A9E5ML04_9GAMM|nr:TonB-dependent receptor [Aestuariicella hydrocarbonica]NHO66157.1 TonB-dependent receptor [Aestuariicella hydrocarbonica]
MKKSQAPNAVVLHSRWKKSLAATALSISLTPLAASVQAQTNASPRSDQPSLRQIEEVIVTARRREESAQSVPIAVTALDAGELEEFNISDIGDLQYFDASLNVSSSSGRPNAPVYSLRGVRPTEAIFGQDPTVAIYLADVVLSPAKGSNLGMYDLASVQVLKGPQGTLFGRNTTGGAILLTPKKPGEVISADIMVGFGSYGLMETEFGVDLPVTDTFAMRLAGRTTDEDGHQKNVAPGKYYGDKRGGGENYSTRLTAIWNVSETIQNDTILTWDKTDLNGRTPVLQTVNPSSSLALYNGGAPFGLPSMFDALSRAQNRDVHKIESDMRERSQADVWGIINTTTIDFNENLSLKSIAAYRDLDAYEVVDLDATAIPGVLTSMQTTELEHASYELQLLGSALDSKLDWVTGLYWYYEDGIEDSPGNVFEGINPANPFMQTATMHNNSYSLFSQGTYQFDNAWSVAAGIRWTYDDKELTTSSRTPLNCAMFDDTGAPLPIDQCSVKMTESFSQPTGTVSIEYQPNDDTMFYASTRLGYRAGGFNARASRAVEYQPFDPETVVDLELGSKIDWSLDQWMMRTNAAFYHQWYDDIQRTVAVDNPVGTPGSAIENAAEATVLGFEIEQTVSPTENLTLKLQYVYTDAEYAKWEEPASGKDLSDTPFYFTPEHAFTASVSYSYPLANDTGVLRFSANAAYQDDVWLNALQTIELIDQTPANLRSSLQQDAFWLVGLSLGWDNVLGSKLDLSAYVKNLTDEEYALGGVMLYPTFGLSTKVYGEPRNYGMQLRYQF